MMLTSLCRSRNHGDYSGRFASAPIAMLRNDAQDLSLFMIFVIFTAAPATIATIATQAYQGIELKRFESCSTVISFDSETPTYQFHTSPVRPTFRVARRLGSFCRVHSAYPTLLARHINLLPKRQQTSSLLTARFHTQHCKSVRDRRQPPQEATVDQTDSGNGSNDEVDPARFGGQSSRQLIPRVNGTHLAP